MNYLLEEILTIRKHREKVALGHILAAQKEVTTAELKREKSISELISFKKLRNYEEKRLIEELMRQPIDIYELENFNRHVEFFKEKQFLLADNVKKREQEISEAKRKLKEAQRHYADLNRAKQKLQEHKNSWMQVKYFENERRQDDEHAEFNTNVRSRSSCDLIKP
jgi:hypothetical protein